MTWVWLLWMLVAILLVWAFRGPTPRSGDILREYRRRNQTRPPGRKPKRSR